MQQHQLVDQLKERSPELQLSVRSAILRAYSRDCWPIYQARYWKKPIEALPAVVVWPRTLAQVKDVYRFATDARVPVTPIGLGSGVVGGGVPEDEGIVLDLRRLDTLFELDKRSNLLTVGAGWNGQVLEDTLNAEGYTGGHFPSSIMMSSPGGWMAARGAGQLSTRYGKFEDRLVGCRWVFPDGRDEWIRNDGIDEGILELLTGSEGTLGAATEIQFRVDPLPETRHFAAYDFVSVDAALAAMRKLLQAGLRPAAVRLYDPIDTLLHSGIHRAQPQSDDVKDAHGASGGITTSRDDRFVKQLLRRALRLVLNRPAGAQQLLERFARKSMLILMFEGPDASVQWQAQESVRLLSGTGRPLGPGPAQAWLRHRYSITGKQADVLKAGGFFDTMEVAFPWSKLYEGYQAVRKALQGEVLLMAHFSHVYGDGGCIYFSFVGYKPGRLENERHYREVWRLALDAVTRSGGTITHHHGVGLLKAKWMADEWQAGYPVLKHLKKSMDPAGIANPGKLGL